MNVFHHDIDGFIRSSRQKDDEKVPMSWSRRLAALLPRTVAQDNGGAEPDPRFTFANERTFLAWSRTALALVVAGLGIVQLLPPFPGVPAGRYLIGLPLIVLGAVLAVAAYAEWVRNQRALRRGEPLPRSVMPWILAATVTGIAIIAGVVLILSAVG
jgi:putative membrane protein